MMNQDLVIKLKDGAHGAKVAAGSVQDSPPLLYVNLVRLFPQVSFSENATPSEVEPLNYGVFQWEWEPDLPYNKSADSVGVTRNSNGIWKPTFVIRNATQEEIDQRKIEHEAAAKHRRYAELRHSDFIFSDDVPESISSNMQAWLDYRTALRDIPTQSNFPFEIVWPERPVSLDF
jgi:hypothetical protein